MITSSWSNPNVVENMIQIINRNGTVISMTDTIYGLLTKADRDGVSRLNSFKDPVLRKNKSYIVLVDSITMAKTLCRIPETKDVLDHIATWPCNKTLILPSIRPFPSGIVSDEGMVAIRIPDHQKLRTVISKTGPLLSTSVNISGSPPIDSLWDIDISMMKGLDMIVMPHYDSKISYRFPSEIYNCYGGVVSKVC